VKTSLKTWAVDESAIAQVVFARERSTHHRDGLHCKMTAGTPGQAREFDRALLPLNAKSKAYQKTITGSGQREAKEPQGET
jgi:hypothetical protein